MTDLVCLGEPLIEFNETSPRVFQQNIGGDINNCAVAAARSGLTVAVISALGNDRFAKPIRQLWQQENIDDRFVTSDAQRSTGLYFVHHDEQGHHFSYARKDSAASAFKLTDEQRQVIKKAKVLHLSGISLALSEQAEKTALEAIQIAQDNQTLLSFDTNYRSALWSVNRAKAVINPVAKQADFLFPSLDDAKQLLGSSDKEHIVKFYQDNKTKIIALTVGKNGVYICHSDSQKHVNAYPVKAVDATAAGDTFDGAFLAEFLRQGDALAAAHYASAASALCVCRYGAINAIPNRTQIETFLNSKAHI